MEATSSIIGGTSAIFVQQLSCVRQVQQKDLRYVGPSESRGRGAEPLARAQRSARSGLGSLPHHEFLVFAKFLHVEITMLLKPVLMGLDGQSPD